MAYWFRKRGKVYVCYRRDGKIRTLPRHKTAAFDGDEDHNIDAFAAQVALQYENKKVTPNNIFQDDSELNELVQGYLSFIRSRHKSANTVKWHETALRRDVIPFFLDGENPLRDPQQWPGKSIKMHTWLLAREDRVATYNLLTRANIALRGFYRFWTEEGRIQNGVDLRLRTPAKNPTAGLDDTPLGYALKPDEVLKYALAQTNTELRLIALLGYFFSLRPYEIFGLQPSDFLPGKAAEELECCKIMSGLSVNGGGALYHRFAVHITRQRTPTGIAAPKSFSRGWVSCFDERAARLLVPILREVVQTEPILSQKVRALFELWRTSGIPGITIKDLRRASLYHLGHHTTFDIAKLQKHARHKYSVTTEKYLRQPGEKPQKAAGWDLDDD